MVDEFGGSYADPFLVPGDPFDPILRPSDGSGVMGGKITLPDGTYVVMDDFGNIIE